MNPDGYLYTVDFDRPPQPIFGPQPSGKPMTAYAARALIDKDVA